MARYQKRSPKELRPVVKKTIQWLKIWGVSSRDFADAFDQYIGRPRRK